MSDHWEPLHATEIRAAADMTWRQHQPGGNLVRPGTCPHCTPTGCSQLDWAVKVRAHGPEAKPVTPPSVVPLLLAGVSGN